MQSIQFLYIGYFSRCPSRRNDRFLRGLVYWRRRASGCQGRGRATCKIVDLWSLHYSFSCSFHSSHSTARIFVNLPSFFSECVAHLGANFMAIYQKTTMHSFPGSQSRFHPGPPSRPTSRRVRESAREKGVRGHEHEHAAGEPGKFGEKNRLADWLSPIMTSITLITNFWKL